LLVYLRQIYIVDFDERLLGLGEFASANSTEERIQIASVDSYDDINVTPHNGVISQTQMSVLRGQTHVTVMPHVWTWRAATTVCVTRALLAVVPAARVTHSTPISGCHLLAY